MASIADLARKLEQLPDEHFRVFASTASPATEQQIAAFEAKAGRSLPRELREVLLRWGVLIVEAKESIWPRPALYEVAPAWRFEFGFCVFGIGPRVPEQFSIETALTPELRQRGLIAFARRHGGRFLYVVSESAVGTVGAGDTDFEPANGNVIDIVLREIAMLEEGVQRLSATTKDASALVADARSRGWKGKEVSEVVEALKTRPAGELAPHLLELATELLPRGTDSMGCLDIIAAAGAESFQLVAEKVYAHMGEGDDPYVLEVLGKVSDASPRAMELYVEGLGSDDDDVFEYAAGAVKANAANDAFRVLVSTVEGLHASADGERRYRLLGLCGALGSSAFHDLARADLETLDEDDDDALYQYLEAFPAGGLRGSPLAAALVQRAATLSLDKPSTFNVVDALVEKGVVDHELIETVATAFAGRGGMWTQRANRLLAIARG